MRSRQVMFLLLGCFPVVGCTAYGSRPVEVGAWGEDVGGRSLRLRSSDVPFFTVSMAPGVSIDGVRCDVAGFLHHFNRVDLYLTIRNNASVPLKLTLGKAIKDGLMVGGLEPIHMYAEIAGEWTLNAVGLVALAPTDLVVIVKPNETRDVPIFFFCGGDALAELDRVGVVHFRAQFYPDDEKCMITSGPLAWRGPPPTIANFGWPQPIIVDDAGVIIVGHTR